MLMFFMCQNILLAEALGNCDHRRGAGHRAVSYIPKCNGWEVMELEHNLILHHYPCASERGCWSRKKGQFHWLIPTHLAPCIRTVCSGADSCSGKPQCVSCARKELSDGIPSEMETNVCADSDFLESGTTRQNINNIGRCRPLTLCFTFHLWTVQPFSCVCVV